MKSFWLSLTICILVASVLGALVVAVSPSSAARLAEEEHSMADDTTFVPQRYEATRIMQLNGSPDVVYPLFTAQGEYNWIPGWDPDLIYPDTPNTATGTIFMMSHVPNAKTYWLTVQYDPGLRHSIYANVTPEIWIMRLEIRCEPGPEPNTTTVYMTYSVTGLSPQGNAVLDQMFNAEAFAAQTAQMTQWLNYYLAHGEPMQPAAAAD